jgi:histone H3/H4
VTNGSEDFDEAALRQIAASLASDGSGSSTHNALMDLIKEGTDGDDDYLDPSLLTEANLPISNISRLMKKALPKQAKVSSSAKDLIQACCIEFISFLTSEANDKCLLEKRKTINGDDILFAMKQLGFDEYDTVCRIWLSRYRMVSASISVFNTESFPDPVTSEKALEMTNRLKDKEKERSGGARLTVTD